MRGSSGLFKPHYSKCFRLSMIDDDDDDDERDFGGLGVLKSFMAQMARFGSTING